MCLCFWTFPVLLSLVICCQSKTVYIADDVSELFIANLTAEPYNVLPGDTLCLSNGALHDYGHIEIHEIVGEPGKPVIVKNCGGLVRVGYIATVVIHHIIISGLSRHFILSGDGDPAISHGILVTGPPGSTGQQGHTVFILAGVNEFEIRYINASGPTGAIEFQALYQPATDCVSGYYNQTLTGVHIHHCVFSQTYTWAVFFLGNDYLAPPVVCNGQNYVGLYPKLVGAIIEYIYIENNGPQAGGIALAHADETSVIRYCTIVSVQSTGISLSSSDGNPEIYGNLIINPGMQAIFLHGTGVLKIHDNIIIQATNGYYAMEHGGQSSVWAYQNTIIMTEVNKNAIVSYNALPNTPALAYNNLIITPPKTDMYAVRPYAISIPGDDTQNNLYFTNVTDAGFVNPLCDLHLSALSPGNTVGKDLTFMAETFDYDGNVRSAPFSVGAYVSGTSGTLTVGCGLLSYDERPRMSSSSRLSWSFQLAISLLFLNAFN